MHTRNVQIKRS